jgi:hypothetical protein
MMRRIEKDIKDAIKSCWHIYNIFFNPTHPNSKKNIMEFIGLLFEILFLLLGIFVYRLSTGKMKVHEMQRPAMERFIKENGSIMRILSLALIAIMTVEVLLHIFQMFKK